MDLITSMKAAAAVMRVIPKKGDLFVWDSRNNHCTGPYRPCDGEKVAHMCAQLNQQVLQWDLGPFANRVGSIDGPLYVREYPKG